MLPHVNEGQEEDEKEEFDYEKAKEIKWFHALLLNRPLKVILALLLAATLAPVLLYRYTFHSTFEFSPPDGLSTGSCVLQRDSRLLCGLGIMNQTDCHPQCCYDMSNSMCFHRFPSRFSYTVNRNLNWTEDVVLQPRVPRVPYKLQNSLTNIRMAIDEVSSTHLSFHIYNGLELSLEGSRIDNKTYVYHVASPEMNITVNSTQGTIFNTISGPLIASQNIWEFTFLLTNETMYGLGEIPLEPDTVKVIYSHEGGFSSIPLIFAKLNGSYHGLLIDVKTPTEVRIGSGNQVVIRSLTNLGLKFHIFVGPQPKDIMRDVRTVIGFNREIEPWMLGAHICSDVSNTPTEAFTELNLFLEEASREKLQFESHCGIAPIVFDLKECYEEIVEMGAKLVHEKNKRFVPHVSPFVRLEKINDTSEASLNSSCPNILPLFRDIMIRQSNLREMYRGSVGDDYVIYPDYNEAKAAEFIRALWTYKTELDGVIIENSWPLDESVKFHNETYDFLPYFNENFANAFNDTLQWNITRIDGQKHFYTHNEYGNQFSNAIKNVIDEEILIWSTNPWMNGKEIINRQSIDVSWTNLQKELTEAALGGISGHWLWSSPICGDTEHFDNVTQLNLCIKWYMAATYMPMIKIHSKSVPRHPLAFVGTNRRYMMTALEHRLSFLPYFYTTLQTGPLLRPMFYQFPSCEKLINLKSQFSVGEDLLIVPNLQPSQSHVHLWLPPGSWYEIWSGLKLDGEEGDAVTMTTMEADFLTLIHGGSIIALLKDVKETAEETQLHSDFSITIALHCEVTNDLDHYLQNITVCHATGSLYMSEDMSFIFEANPVNLTITAEGNDFGVLCETETEEPISSSEDKTVESSEPPEPPIWAHKIKEINIFGLLDEERNNYDHHRHVDVSIDLCELKSENTIDYTFVPLKSIKDSVSVER